MSFFVNIWYAIFIIIIFTKMYRNTMLPFVLYWCETWSVTLREESMRRVFESRVLRKIFGPTIDEVRVEWRKLHNDELNILCSSLNILRVIKSRRMRWAGQVARMGRWEACTGFWWETPGGERPLRRTRRRWEDNIKMDLQKVGCGGMDWIELALDRGR